MIRVKRVREPSEKNDGYRVLIDRLWPRGVRKDDAHLDAWVKELAPSDALRKWFGHDPDRFGEFRARFKRELREPAARAAFDELARRADRATVTLVYDAHDPDHNNAVVLAGELDRRLRPRRRAPRAAAKTSRARAASTRRRSSRARARRPRRAA